MSIFTKKLADWNLIDCIKMTIGTIAVGYAAEKVYETIGTIAVGYVAEKVYEEYQKRQKVNGVYDDDFGNDVYAQEEETSE